MIIDYQQIYSKGTIVLIETSLGILDGIELGYKNEHRKV